MYIDINDFENLVIDGVEPIISEYSINELQMLKERNCNSISQFIIAASVKANEIKNRRINGDIKSYINFLDIVFRDNKAFNPSLFYDTYKAHNFRQALVSKLGYNKLVFGLVDIYKYSKDISSDSNDYYAVKDIFNLLKLCCKNFKIKTPTLDELNTILTNPDSNKYSIYGITLSESDNSSYMDTMPFYVDINCDSKKYIISINQSTCYLNNKIKNKQNCKSKKG